jgi:two-component system response regulator YesN
MIGLLIVDDEQTIRQGLKDYVPWHEMGINILGTAEDGIDALEKIKELKPDIVMADIRMPRMDGLQLAQRLKNIAPEIKIIFLTGYDDFSYAKQAVTLNVEDYVLKPVSRSDLIECIQRVKNKLLDEEKERREREALKRHIAESLPFLKTWFFNAVEQKDDIWQRLSTINIDLEKGAFMAMVVTIDDINSQDADSDYYALFKLYNSITLILDETEDTKSVAFFENRTFTIILSFPCNIAQNIIGDIVLNVAYKIKDLLDYALDGSYTIGVGQSVNDIKYIEGSHKGALEACEHRFYMGERQIIYISDVEPAVREQRYKMPNGEEFMTIVKIGNEQKAKAFLRDMFEDMREQRENIDIVKRACLELIVYTSRAMYEIGERPEVLFSKTDPWYEINRRFTIDQLYDFMANVIDVVMGHLSIQRKSRNQKIVDEVKSIIATQYAKDISLETVAEKVYISPCYLSSIFSQEAGITFKEYLIKVRIDKAKELLKESSVKIYEVAESVGYNDSHYFSQLFKKYTGFTPAQYRDSQI